MPHALTTEERKKRIAENPASTALIEEALAYMEATHLDHKQFASYIGYGKSTMQSWLHNRYHLVGGSDRLIARAVRSFLDANPIIATEENRGRFYETENVGIVRGWFDHCLGLSSGRGRMVGIYSGPGGQKTFISENLIAEFNRENLNNPARPRALYIYCSQDITPGQLVIKVLAAAGLASCGMIQKNLASLRYSMRGSRTILVMDESQHLSVACLEVVRELNDLRPYFGILLLGSHKLRKLFDQHAAEMEQWNSRMTAFVELPGMSDTSVLHIIDCELGELMTDWSPKLRKEKIAGLLSSCETQDIYSRHKKMYRSARRLFRSIEQIKEQARAKALTAAKTNHNDLGGNQ